MVRQLLSLFLGSAEPKAAESASSAPSTQRRAASAALRCRQPFLTSFPPRRNVGSFKYAATKFVFSCSDRWRRLAMRPRFLGAVAVSTRPARLVCGSSCGSSCGSGADVGVGADARRDPAPLERLDPPAWASKRGGRCARRCWGGGSKVRERSRNARAEPAREHRATVALRAPRRELRSRVTHAHHQVRSSPFAQDQWQGRSSDFRA